VQDDVAIVYCNRCINLPCLLSLVQERNNHLAVARVEGVTIFAVELLLVVSVLSSSPDEHLIGTSKHEQVTSNRLSHNVETQPSQNLNGVVGARDKFEEESPGNLTFLRASRSQVAQNDMAVEIGELTDDENGQTDVDMGLRGSGKLGVVDKVGNIGGKTPVVAAIFEEIEQRHSSMRESVDK